MIIRTRYIAVFFILTIVCSCGGVAGSIEKYSFPNVHEDTLKAGLNRVYVKYPELRKVDTTMYGKNNGNDFYFLLAIKGDKIAFQCNVISYPPPNEDETDLALTTAAHWGETMLLSGKIKTATKEKFKRLFEEHILPKIKEEIKGG